MAVVSMPHGTGIVIDWATALLTHDRWLRTAVFARVREPHAVDEIMQEVAVSAIEQRSPLADSTKVAPWLYRLSVLTALRWLRSRARERKRNLRRAEQSLLETEHAAMDPLRLLLVAERVHIVQSAIERLARRDAEILLLKYTEHWNNRELAAHLGISEHAAESRLQRARDRLRAALTTHEFEKDL